MKKNNDRIIDLSDIKEDDLDKTSSFTDLMTRSERKRRQKEKQNNLENAKIESNDIEDMILEAKKSNVDFTRELKKSNISDKKKIELQNNDDKEESISKTQILELTRQMKFNFEETKEKNTKAKRKGISTLNIIGEVNLLCIGYYIYLLVFTNYQDDQQNYLITGGIIVLLVLLFGFSIITGKKISKFFNILNILAIIGFISFNIFTLIN